MTETTRIDWSSAEIAARIKARRKAEGRLRLAGLVALILAIGMLALLVGSLVLTGRHAITQTHVTFDVTLPADEIDASKLNDANWRKILGDGFSALFPDADRKAKREIVKMLSQAAPYDLRDQVAANPALIGQTVTVTVPMADPYDQLHKGLIDPTTPEENRRLKDHEIAWFNQLDRDGRISRPLNTALLVNADSRFPEVAGLKGALIGSFYTLLVCFLISFPVGIAAGVYLEEFAPKNRWTDLIEININNLAAVPSVVFGLLALAVLLGWFGMPRSAPLVGGITLALMTLPTIIIATRNAVKAVPPSIRDAALGVGASHHQVTLHHVLPLAMPGILTGTIIGLARALGETAPLLLIGMNAFITAAPEDMLSSSTALPTQIFIWADSPERGFAARTSAAILVLLGFLIVMNGLAVWLRRKFERSW